MNVEDEIRLGDRGSQIGQAIGHGLHGSAVGEHRHVALEEEAELGVEVDGP